ncbi:MAG: hypothetical protein ABIH66_13885 [bacterium]
MSEICKFLVTRGWNYYFEACMEGGATGFRAEATKGDIRLVVRGDTLRHALSRLMLDAIEANGLTK